MAMKAMHGTISVSGHVVASWSARRVGPLNEIEDIHNYDWELVTALGERHGGTLNHRYGAGAVELAGLVMAAASRRGAGRLPRDSSPENRYRENRVHADRQRKAAR
jgi:hypothetical protein